MTPAAIERNYPKRLLKAGWRHMSLFQQPASGLESIHLTPFSNNLTADFRWSSQTKNGKEQSAKRIASAFKPSAFTRQRLVPDSLLLAAYCLLLTLYALRHALSACPCRPSG